MKSQEDKKELRRKLPTLKSFSHDQIKTRMYVKSSSPYVSILKKTNRMISQLGKRKSSHVSIMGMGKAVNKTLSIAAHFQSLNHYKVEIFTRTLQVLDEMYDDNGIDESGNKIADEDREVKLQARKLSGVEVWISQVPME